MKIKKLLGFFMLLLGAVLLSAALLLLRHNREEDIHAGLAAGEALESIQQALKEGGAQEESAPDADSDTAQPVGEILPLPTMTIDGHDYVGYLDIPDLKLNLPVIKIVYLDELQTAPCLEQGSPHSNDAVISAHNYPTHFGRLKELKGGETITFTDMNGEVIEYSVAEIKTIAPDDVELVRESEHDLVLYTCTLGGQNRVMVACDRADKDE